MDGQLPYPRSSFSVVRDNGSLRRARWLVATGLFLAVAWFGTANPFDKPLGSLILATAVVVTSVWPLFRWLTNRNRDAIPALAMHALYNGIAFGVPGFLEPGGMFNLGWTSESERQVALLLALLGLLSLYIGYYGVGAILRNSSYFRWPIQVHPGAYPVLVFFVYPLLLLAKGLVAETGLSTLPTVASVVESFVFILLLHAAFIGRLPGVARHVVLYLMLPYKLIIGSGLADAKLGGFLAEGIAVGLTYVAARRRVPFQLVIVLLGVIVLLQPIKGEFRAFAWGQGSDVSSEEKIQLFVKAGLDYYFYGENVQQKAEEGVGKSFDRINQLMVTAAVYADTPRRQPFLYGESYLPLLTKWIPRYLWPDKPREDFGNRWAQRYGYLHTSDNVTSFNLPWLPEMYMNFGLAGVLGVNLLVGFLFRFLAENLWRAPRDSSAFAFGLTMGMSLMFVEANLSLMLGREIIAAVTLVVLGLISAIAFPKVFIRRMAR
jgi:hypothetical protein